MSRVTRSRETPVGRRRLTGVLVLAAIIALAVLAYVRPNPFADELTIRAMFDDAAGIGVVGSEVRMAGTPVGKISERRRVGDDALVIMQLDSDAGPIRRDARAELRPRTAFEGTAFVNLRPGSDGAAELGDAVLPKARTRNFVALDEALRFAEPDVRAALSDDVRALARVLRGEGSAGLRGALRDAPTLTRDLSAGTRAARGPTGTELQGAIEGFAATVTAVAAEETSLRPLLRSAGPTFEALDTDDGAPLDRALRVLPGTVSELDRGGRALASLVDRVDVVGGELRPGLRALAPAVDAVRPLVRSAEPVLAQAPPLLHELRMAVDAGGAAARPADRLLRSLDPTLKLLDSSLLPALAKPTSLGLPAYLQFISLFQGGAGAFRPFLPPGDGPGPGPGHFTRFSARFFTGIGLPAPPCSGIGRVNEQAADLLSKNGLCTP